MTLDEAIQHCKEVAIEYKAKGECYECGKEHRQLAEWLEDYKQLKDTTRWIPCSERMPFEPGVHVLVTDGLHIMESWYEIVDGEALWVDNYTMYVNICFGNVTHWMPLPDPPKEG